MATIFTENFTQGGHSNYSAVHMRDQRNAKKWLFFEAKRDSRESRLGVKMCPVLRKRVFLDPSKVRLGIIFQTPPNMSSKTACLGVDLGAKSPEILD